MKPWIAFEAANGTGYADPDHIIGLGAPMWNTTKTVESRSLMMSYGYIVILNSEENITRLRLAGFTGVALDAHEQHAPLPAPKVKKAKAEKPETKSPAPRGKKGPTNG